MQIIEWLTQDKLNQSDFARIIGCNRVRAHRIVHKGFKPTDEEMLKIFIASNGRVDGNDIYKLPVTLEVLLKKHGFVALGQPKKNVKQKTSSQELKTIKEG